MITQQQQVLKEVKKEAARAEILDDLSPLSTLLSLHHRHHQR